MTEIKVKDTAGQTISLIDMGQYRTSYYGKPAHDVISIQRALPDFKFRDDDILLASYPKTGCNWTYEIVSMMLKGRAERSGHTKMVTMLEATFQEDMDKLPSPRLLNTHTPFHRLPGDYVARRDVRTILVTRNPKDTAVSLFHQMTGMEHYGYSGTFANWLPVFLNGDLNYLPFHKYHLEWEEGIEKYKLNVLLVYYEDLKKDTMIELKRIADFLALSLDGEVLSDICKKCQFKEMKKAYSEHDYAHIHYTSKHRGFFRKGVVGDWKNWFTVAQSEQVDKLMAENMKNSKMKFVYEL